MFIEVLDRIGEVKARLRIEGEVFSVGRAYDNDLILDDPYVAPYHLRISRHADGSLQAADLGTKNGLYALDPSRRVDCVRLGGETRVRIGHTQLRFRDAEYKVAEEMEARPAGSVLRTAGVFYLTLLATAMLLALDAYMSSFDDSKPIQIIAAVVTVLLITFVWAGTWAFVGKLTTRKANIYAHATAALLAIMSLTLVHELSGYIEFSFSAGIAQLAAFTAIALIVAALIYRHLRLVSRVSIRRAAGSAAAVVCVVLGSGWLVQYSASVSYSSALDYSGSLKAPAFKLSASITPETFVVQAEELRKQVDELRDKK